MGHAGERAGSDPETLETADPFNTEGLDSKLSFVLGRYYERNFGGPAAWEATQSIRFDGVLNVSGGRFPFVAFKKKPNLCKVVLFTPGGGRIVSAYDGSDAWALNTSQQNGQPVSMPEKEAQDFIRDASFFGHLVYPKLKSKQIEILGVTRVEDNSCYEIKITLPNGAEILSFLDTASYAERKIVATNASTGQQETIIFSDFREIGGVRFPFASVKRAGGEMIHRVETTQIQLNLGVMSWMFQRPAGAYVPGLLSAPVDRSEPARETLPPAQGSGRFGEDRWTVFPDPEQSGNPVPNLLNNSVF